VLDHTVSESGACQVVILSGPSGSGKSTLVNRLLQASGVNLIKAISATTRPPRTTEVDGSDYYFLSYNEFMKRRDTREFLEFAEVHGSGYWYGTLHSELQRARNAGGWPLLEIDVQGTLQVMEQFPNVMTFFLKTPSEDVYEQRLRDRGTEPENVIHRRLHTAREELRLAERYRYQIVNDDLDRAVREIVDILELWEAKLNA